MTTSQRQSIQELLLIDHKWCNNSVYVLAHFVHQYDRQSDWNECEIPVMEGNNYNYSDIVNLIQFRDRKQLDVEWK